MSGLKPFTRLADSAVVTSVLLPAGSTLDGEVDAPSRPSWTDAVEHSAVVAVAVFWAGPFVHAAGGRGVHAELLFAIVLIAAAIITRAWRAPVGSLIVSAVVSLAAISVCWLAPTGWWGADAAAGYVLAGATYVVGRRYVRASERRFLVASVVCLAGLYQFSESFLAWWGSRTPMTEMSGTFYWHNPYAAFLLPGAIIGVGLVATHRSPWRLVGWVAAPMCTAGIVYSTSRATLAALLVAWLLVLLAVRSRAVLVRAGGVMVLSVAVVFVLPGPPFFTHYTSPFSTVNERSTSGQTLQQNGAYRVEFWKEAVQVATHHPGVGGGFHSLATASAMYTPSGWARSQLAHDGYLQAFADGGLLLGLPFLFAVLIVMFWALRRAWILVAHGPGRVDEVLTGIIGVALLAAYAHSAVDFDWSHPGILVEIALLAACVAPERNSTRPSRRVQVLSGVGLFALLGVLGILVPALHRWQLDQPSSLTAPSALIADAQSVFGDYRPARQVLIDKSLDRQPVSDAQVADALALTRRESSVDLHLALLREAAAAQIGRDPNAVARANAILRNVHGSLAPYVPDLATVMIAAGDDAAARSTLRADLTAQERSGVPSPDFQSEIALWATQLGRGAGYACQLQAARRLPNATGLESLPRPQVNCPAHPD